MEGSPFNMFGDPDELRARMQEMADQMQSSQEVAWADNADPARGRDDSRIDRPTRSEWHFGRAGDAGAGCDPRRLPGGRDPGPGSTPGTPLSELHVTDRGDGPPVLLIHGTGTDSSVFDDAVGSLGGSWRLITPDRRGWGESVPVDEYRRTSIPEQSIEIASLLRERQTGPATVIGIGFGAVVALELALADPDLVARAFVIEPPVFGALSEATTGMSIDVDAIRAAAAEGGEEAAYDLFLAGELQTLGCGAERFNDKADRGPAAARSFLVELPAVPAWPLDPVRLVSLEPEVTVVTLPSTPDLLKRAARAVVDRVPGAGSLHASRDGIAAVAALLA